LLNNYFYFHEEIATTRLVYINKDASKLGDINNIRGISINSIIIKFIIFLKTGYTGKQAK